MLQSAQWPCAASADLSVSTICAEAERCCDADAGKLLISPGVGNVSTLSSLVPSVCILALQHLACVMMRSCHPYSSVEAFWVRN